MPITPSTTWPEFVETVCRKLKLGSAGDGIELFVGEEVLQSLDQLEDIAEVVVRDGRGSGDGRGGSDGSDGSGGGGGGIGGVTDAFGHGAHNGRGVLLTDGNEVGTRASPFSGAVSIPERTVPSTKYVKKQSDVALALGRIQSVFGAGGQHDGGAGQSLPVTTRKGTPMGSDLTPIEQVKRRMKKRRRSMFDPRTLLALFSVLSVGVMMIFVYLRVVGGGEGVVVGELGGGRKVLPGGA